MNSFNFRIFTFLLLIVSVSFGQDTYFDDFRDRTYSNSYGTINWSSNPWNEVNDNNSATGGFIRITNGGELRFREVYQNLEYLERTVDLSSASAVNLSFDWRSTSALASGFNLDVQINSGSGFVTLFTINGTGSNNSGTFSQDISSHISASTVIRIINTGPNWPDTNDTVFIDDVLFSLTTSPPSNPILLIEDVTVNEGDGSAVFTVTHTGGSASGSFNVGFTTGNGSAVAGNDYTAATGTLNFSGTTGDTETITVSIIDDLDDEPNETFSIEFTSKSDNSVNITDTATGTIVDNDDPKVLTINDVSVNEDDGTATFTVTHTGTNSSSSFTVDYATVDGTATAGSDYVAKTGTLNFNGTSGDTENITITITDDTNVDNLFETFTITLSSPSDSSFDVSDVGNGSIRDNDAILISDEGSVSACSDTFLDSGGIDGNYGINEDFTITICPDSPNKNVNIDFSSFSTENNFDFLFIYEGTSTSGTQIGTYDGNLGSFSVTSSDSSGCLTLRFTSDGSIVSSGWESTISCLDKVPTLIVDDVTVNEGDGTATFTITHTELAASGSFDVTYQTVQGTATAGDDYTTTTGTISFDGSLGDTETITVPIIDDTRYGEPTETFTIELLTTTDSNVDISDTATGGITDNETILNDVPLTLYDDLSGNFEYAVTGGSLRTQDNNTNACSVTTSSSGTLTTTVLPAGKTVVKAYLYWAHSNFNVDQDVTLEGSTVSADLVYGAGFGGLQFYGYVADVTDVITGITNPWAETYDFGGLTIDSSATYCNSAVVLGAWSLMIFYEDLALPSSTINLYYGFDVTQNAGTSFTLDNFFAISPTGSKASFLSYEGDATLDGTVGTNKEELSVQSESAVTPTILTGDGSQTGNNPFNSTIYDGTSGTNITTAYGLDLDTYDISSFINTSDTQVTANVDAGQDLVISSAVVLKVPSNLISGVVFEDINYPGGSGRNETVSSGVGIPGVTVELYNSLGLLQRTETTDANGGYTFGGMSDGTYTVRVVNSSVRSTRGGGVGCTTCYGVQTYRSSYDGISINEVTDEIGGAIPSSEDVAAGTLTNAQTVSTVSVFGGGTGAIDFGFNFNTIVNTNDNGQGSLEQFIVNSNNLDEIGLDIEANAIFDPASGVDTSIFMIPPSGDPQGRTADANYNGSFFDIFAAAANPFSNITDDNTSIDGRTQTAYSGDTNTGTAGNGGTTVGTSAIVLPNYDLPEIQIHRNGGDVIIVDGNNTIIRNMSIYANNNAAIQIIGGSVDILENLLGTNALGVNSGNLQFGVENVGGNVLVDSNYIATNTEAGLSLDGGTSNIIQNNHIANNGNDTCDENIRLENSSGVVIQQNLIENAASTGIDAEQSSGNLIISENTITGSGRVIGDCGGVPENMGIDLAGNNSQIINNIIHSNGGAGLTSAGSGTGNLISQNSFYANGTTDPSLGIDLNQDGVTLNDNGDSDTGSNNLVNYPIISGANISGANMIITGWARPGSVIEFFSTDINEGTAALGDNQFGLTQDYGEGQIYLATRTEGSTDDTNGNVSSYTDGDSNTDNTNMFTFVIPLPSGVDAGTDITATATISNSTSEFSPFSTIKTYTIITNRRITYRVKKD